MQFDRLKRPKTLHKETPPSYDYSTADDEDSFGVFDQEPDNDGSLSPREKRPSRDSRSASAPEVRTLPPYPPQGSQPGSSSKKAAKDPLGLTPISSPAKPIVDIIFIHGLGGSAFKSWSWEHDPRLFWPAWLVKEPQLSAARVHTFGYAASISGTSNVPGVKFADPCI